MKEWICREMSTSTSGNENGVLMMETELIRCKDCQFSHITADGLLNKYCDNMTDDDGNKVELYVESTFYCGWAERKEE